MARRRFFVDAVQDGRAELLGDDAHHLTRVLRAETGQQYEISDGHSVYLAEISSLSKSTVEFRVLNTLEQVEPSLNVVLFMALIKFDRFEWVVEKSTELGVTTVVPVECARSEAGLLAASAKRSERWRKIARESSQQSRRTSCPFISDALRLTQAMPVGFGCHMEELKGAAPLSQVLLTSGQAPSLSVLIGPEGGWTDHERTHLAQNGWLAASLGPLVLRAETAAIAALAIAGQHWLARQA